MRVLRNLSVFMEIMVNMGNFPSLNCWLKNAFTRFVSRLKGLAFLRANPRKKVKFMPYFDGTFSGSPNIEFLIFRADLVILKILLNWMGSPWCAMQPTKDTFKYFWVICFEARGMHTRFGICFQSEGVPMSRWGWFFASHSDPFRCHWKGLTLSRRPLTL